MLFWAVDGFDVSYGLSIPNQLEARVNRTMAEAARRPIVVCDSAKFSRSLSLIMPILSVHETITDRGIPKQDLNAFREAEMEVALAIRWFLLFPGNVCA
jgi:DeoR/GlpR family transcriptional regulator of sugar metabolism